MELSREIHRCAKFVVDKAADMANASRDWARQVTLFHVYRRSLERVEDDMNDEFIPPERAAVQLLLNVIGNMQATGVTEVLSLLELSDDSRPFADSLLTRSKPVLHSLTGTVGGPEEVMKLAREAKDLGTVASFAAVRSALSSVSSFDAPSGCEPVSIFVGGCGKYTFSTMAPADQSQLASQYLQSVVARAQEAWHDSVMNRPINDVEKRSAGQRSVSPESRLRQAIQPSLNIGVVGDVAHGKSTLVKAMSGKRTQAHSREQQQHGISIRLGFANAAILHCQNICCGAYSFLSESKDKLRGKPPACNRCENATAVDTRVSFIDCPGHAELMATMLSGASAFDLVLFAAASNAECPTPQAKQHLLAVKTSGVLDGAIDNIALIQTKSELVASSSQNTVSSLTPSERLESHAARGKKSLQKTVGRNAPSFPVCAPLGVGLESIAEWIAKRSKELSEANSVSIEEGDCPAPQLIVLRSFDVNRPGKDFHDMVGGIVGGAIVGSGKINVGDTLEMRPGLRVGGGGRKNQEDEGDKKTNAVDEDDRFVVQPLQFEFTSLMSGKMELTSASKGGLIAVGTTFCPSFAADNGLVGSVVGPAGTLPPVWGPNLYLDRLELVMEGETRTKAKDVLLRKGTEVRCHVGSATVSGTVVRTSAKRKKLQVCLRKPLCGSGGVALEAKTKSGVFVVAAHGRISGGDCCVEGVDHSNESETNEDCRRRSDSLDSSESRRQADKNLDDDDLNRARFLEALDAVKAEGHGNESLTRLSLPKPKLRREGKAHMVVENFGLLAASLRRDPRHLMKFLQIEGGVLCALAGTTANAPPASLRLTWRGGRGFPERFGSILKRYVTTYVVCIQCRGAVTELAVHGAACELSCRKCNASRFVPKL